MIHQKRIFSGIQPTGQLTLGNYLGAIRNWVQLQDDCETLYCVVDQHAVTVYQDPSILGQATLEVGACLMACGLRVDNNILFNQSRNSDQAELAWYFNCVAPMGWLNRMTQFKEKAGKNRENASTGLFTYPNLMAADILAYKATHVPVGEDQKQHLELCRDIAQKFNNNYDCDDFFPLTEPQILGDATRVMSLRDGTKKMSKSDPSPASRIHLTDTVDDIAKKIRKATTDSNVLPTEVDGLKDRPEAKNLVTIYSALQGQTVAQGLQAVGGMGWGEFKRELADVAIAQLGGISAEFNRLMADPEYVDGVLKSGAEKAKIISQPILKQVREHMGFLQ